MKAKKIKSDFGTIVRRGHTVQINMRLLFKDAHDVPVSMRVSVNTKTGRVIGDALSVLAFSYAFMVPILASYDAMVVNDGGKTRSMTETELRQGLENLHFAMVGLRLYQKRADNFASVIGDEIGLNAFLEKAEKVLSIDFEEERRKKQNGGENG